MNLGTPLSVVCVQIANGYSPEFRVFDRMSRVSHDALKATVIYNRWNETDGDAPRFAARAAQETQPPMHGVDFGWRSVAAGRSFAQKALPYVRLAASLPTVLHRTRQAKPDVIYSSQQLWDCRVATFLAKRLRVPQVIHLHYHVGKWLHQPVLNRLLACDHVVTVSDFIRREALRHGVAPERVTTILNTADPLTLSPEGSREAVRAELGVAPDAPFWGNISRLDPEKGQEDILRAFARVVREFPEARLLIVGSETPWKPGYRAHLETLAAELKIERQVIFAGFRSDVPRLLAALDGFIHPSFKEPFGLAIAEAAQAGLPIVAYADGGTPELVHHGVTGLLAELSAGHTGLAEAWAALIGDPQTARRMGRAAKTCITSGAFVPQFASHSFLQTLCRVVRVSPAPLAASVATQKVTL
ncbi:MAG: glycosyltransferase family 4 protein [Armatimonadetes bacterium]|nr:glycosyltransferase family 4 protein [Armatimonadota bacterium]